MNAGVFCGVSEQPGPSKSESALHGGEPLHAFPVFSISFTEAAALLASQPCLPWQHCPTLAGRDYDVMVKLNLGGGEKSMAGWETVDLFSSNPLYRVDLSVFPWPFADKSADAVAMFHFLEHLNDVEQTVQEVHRILKTGGEFWVIVPHAKNPTAWDISHRHCFSCVTFSTIAEKSYYRFNGKQLFKTVFFQMPLIQHRWIKWTPLDLISSRFPYFFEKFIPIAPAHIEWKGIAL